MTDKSPVHDEITKLAVNLGAMQSDMRHVLGALEKMTEAVTRLAVVDERVAHALEAIGRTQKDQKDLAERVARLENAQPLANITRIWVFGSVIFCVGVVAHYILKSTGLK